MTTPSGVQLIGEAQDGRVDRVRRIVVRAVTRVVKGYQLALQPPLLTRLPTMCTCLCILAYHPWVPPLCVLPF